MADIERIPNCNDEETVIDLGKYWNKLKNGRKTLLRWCIGGFVLGCVIALGTPRKFKVTTELAPELSSTATNRLSSMASMLGFSSTMLGTTDAVYPMVYPDILHSSEFVADLFDMPVSVRKKKDTIETTLYDYLLNYQNKSVLMTVLTSPMLLVGWISDFFREKEVDDAPVDPFHFTRKQARVVKMLTKSIEAKIDKKTMVLSVTVTAQDKVICAELAREVNRKLREYVTVYRTQKAVQDSNYYEKLYNEARADYFDAQERYSSYTDSHQNVSLSRYMIESERLKSEANLKYQLYNSMAQQLQTAKAKVQMETPVFVEIVPPTVPFKSANSRKKTALIFAFLGLAAGCVKLLVFSEKERQ